MFIMEILAISHVITRNPSVVVDFTLSIMKSLSVFLILWTLQSCHSQTPVPARPKGELIYLGLRGQKRVGGEYKKFGFYVAIQSSIAGEGCIVLDHTSHKCECKLVSLHISSASWLCLSLLECMGSYVICGFLRDLWV